MSKTNGYLEKSIILTTSTQINLIRVFNEKSIMTRKELVEELDIARTTVYDNLKNLLKLKVVEKFIRYEGKRGRPKVYWKRGY